MKGGGQKAATLVSGYETDHTADVIPLCVQAFHLLTLRACVFMRGTLTLHTQTYKSKETQTLTLTHIGVHEHPNGPMCTCKQISPL